MGKRKAVEGEEGGDANQTTSSGIVEAANALSQDEFGYTYWDYQKYTLVTSISLRYAENMGDTSLKACFDLIEKTSRHDYEPSSFGWHPKRKLREMKEKEMRYILLVHPSYLTPVETIKGFMSFMLTHDSVPSVPVLYIYEVHLDETSRGQGLGKHMMFVAEDIARKVGVKKVMLTCFKSNDKARNFYEKLGYAVDVSSPEDRKTRKKVVKTDYVIMSKEVSSQPKKTSEFRSAFYPRGLKHKVSPGSTSKAAWCLTKLPNSYFLRPELRTWIDADCDKPLMDDDQLISVLSEASRLIDEVRSYEGSTKAQERGVNHFRVLTALYVGLQERLNSAHDLQFQTWGALASLHQDFMEFDIYADASKIAPVDYTDMMSRMAGSKIASVPALAGYIDKMPPKMYRQMLIDFRGSDVELGASEAAVDAREQELDQREDDLYARETSLQGVSSHQELAEREAALDQQELELDQREDDLFVRETALQEASARHDRARLNIRARAQALKRREERFAAREKRNREAHRRSDTAFDRERTKHLPDQDEESELAEGVFAADDEEGMIRHLRDHRGIHAPDDDDDIQEHFHEEAAEHLWDAHGIAPPDEDDEDEDEGDHESEEVDEDIDDEESLVESKPLQKSAARPTQNGTANGNKFELPKPEALRGVKVVGNKVETWLRRSGSARDSFGKGRDL